jgi:site-specific DNA-methyltransferase (adenine-specific)
MQITKSPNFYRSDKPRHSIHPTPKPVNLYRWLIRNSSLKEDTVLDCFAGSGTIGVASLRENRNFLACEIEEKFVKHANQRIDKEKNQGKLF